MNPKTLETIREYAEALIVALVLALFIRTFIVGAFKIPSGSMLETLQIGDQLLVTKFAYGVRVPFVDEPVIDVGDPERGDIVVFVPPHDPTRDYIKRIVGVPGDVLEVRDKRLYRNGAPVDEPYTQYKDPRTFPAFQGLPEQLTPEQAQQYFNAQNNPLKRDNMPRITVPKGMYFMMGDNRDESFDSRFWGFVPRDAIVGKAWIIYWSWQGPTDIRWNRIGHIFHNPNDALPEPQPQS